MVKEFNLSSKIAVITNQKFVHEKYIKEFIKKLKEAIDYTWKDITDTYIDSGTISKMHKVWLIDKIDKLAGDDLI